MCVLNVFQQISESWFLVLGRMASSFSIRPLKSFSGFHRFQITVRVFCRDLLNPAEVRQVSARDGEQFHFHSWKMLKIESIPLISFVQFVNTSQKSIIINPSPKLSRGLCPKRLPPQRWARGSAGSVCRVRHRRSRRGAYGRCLPLLAGTKMLCRSVQYTLGKMFQEF